MWCEGERKWERMNCNVRINIFISTENDVGKLFILYRRFVTNIAFSLRQKNNQTQQQILVNQWIAYNLTHTHLI